jgi:hypothetical protein
MESGGIPKKYAYNNKTLSNSYGDSVPHVNTNPSNTRGGGVNTHYDLSPADIVQMLQGLHNKQQSQL